MMMISCDNILGNTERFALIADNHPLRLDSIFLYGYVLASISGQSIKPI